MTQVLRGNPKNRQKTTRMNKCVSGNIVCSKRVRFWVQSPRACCDDEFISFPLYFIYSQFPCCLIYRHETCCWAFLVAVALRKRYHQRNICVCVCVGCGLQKCEHDKFCMQTKGERAVLKIERKCVTFVFKAIEKSLLCVHLHVRYTKNWWEKFFFLFKEHHGFDSCIVKD